MGGDILSGAAGSILQHGGIIGAVFVGVTFILLVGIVVLWRDKIRSDKRSYDMHLKTLTALQEFKAAIDMLVLIRSQNQGTPSPPSTPGGDWP